jgi:glycine dehydrogenase subunit 1
MDFIANQRREIEEMLGVIGIQTIDELFADIPKSLRLARPSSDDGLSESEGLSLMESLAKKNRVVDYDSYLGAGAYQHHVPAIVPSITSRAEFLTSYTPYQAEASQGYLQAIFEFQTAISRLVGLDVANASVYDGASATAESLLMAFRVKNDRKRALIAGSLHPHYRSVVDFYFTHRQEELATLPIDKCGLLVPEMAEPLFDDQVAAVLLPYPTFFGHIEEYSWVIEKAKEMGALVILAANPLVFGLFKSAKELGADIVAGDAQPLGLPLNYGGPYVGYLACKEEYVRQMPGRLVGETKDRVGNRAYTLTLQAREQHIRRERATSNICTNQALGALSVLITLAWYGKEGLPKLALTNYQRANYLKGELKKLGLPIFPGVTFNEFVVHWNRPLKEVISAFNEEKILPGLDLEPYFTQFKDHLLAAVTELKSQEDLDRYVAVARTLL